MRPALLDALASRQAETAMSSDDLALVSCSDSLGGLEYQHTCHRSLEMPLPYGTRDNRELYTALLRDPGKEVIEGFLARAAFQHHVRVELARSATQLLDQ